MNTVQGKNVTVLIDALQDGNYIAVACFSSIEYTYSNELIRKTDANAGLFRKRRVRISDFSVTISGLTTLLNTSTQLGTFWLLQEGVRRTEQRLKIIFEDDGGETRLIYGDFLIETLVLTGGHENGFSDFDLSLQGTGGLHISEVDSPPDLVCFETDSDWWLPSASATSFSGTGQGGKSFAGQTVIAVVRESAPPLVFTSGTPGERSYSFNGTTIGTWASNPFDGVERVFVIWQTVV